MDEYEAEFERLLKREPPPTAGDIEVMARKWGGKPPIPEQIAAFRALAEGSKLEGAAAALDRAFAEPKGRGGRKKKDKPVPGAKDEAGFLLTADGNLAACSANVITALTTEPLFQGVLRYDLLSQATILTRPYPSPRPLVLKDFPRPVTDVDVTWIGDYVSHRGIIINSPQTVGRTIDAVAEQNSFHPFRDYLEGLKWDGKCRIDNLFIKYFGAKNKNPLEAILAGRYFMIGLAARGYKPGCKMDYSPVLEGDQGLLKTSALRILGAEFYGEGMPKIGEKDSQVFLAGKMLIEIAETSAMRKAEVNHVKAFLTYQTDDFRAPYGHRNKKVPRSALFAITTNATDWNKDETGGRRFWPIEVGDVDLEGLKADRDQLFAEAVVCYKAGEPWWPTPDQQAKVFTPAQDDRLDRDAFDEVVADLLKGRTTARLPEIAKELPLAFASWHGKLRAAMSKAGWRATQERVDGGEPIRFWVPRRSFKAEPETEPEPETVDDELPF